MLRNYLAAALRNLVRNRLYAAINIIGLAVGFGAALLIALFVRDELTYDRWIPGHENIYRITGYTTFGDAKQPQDAMPREVADALERETPEAGTFAQLSFAEPYSVRRGDVESVEMIRFTDSKFFELFTLPLIAGDLRTALTEPNGIVLTRSFARKYFGHEAPIGEMLEVDRKVSLQVTAVLEDLPSNTHLNLGILLPIKSMDAIIPDLYRRDLMYAYVRLGPDASVAQLQASLTAFNERHRELTTARFPYWLDTVTAISDIHLHPDNLASMKPAGRVSTIISATGIAVLLTCIAVINFLNLTTARTMRRAVEVGVRKASGAVRKHFIAQFMGESVFFAALGMTAAVAVASSVLPLFNAYLQRTIALNLVHDFLLTASLILAVLTAGVVAGAFPALFLSKIPAAAALRRRAQTGTTRASVRQFLVSAQFAVLIVLALVATIIIRQAHYTSTEALRLRTDQMLQVSGGAHGSGCAPAFVTRVRALPGVEGAACMMGLVLGGPTLIMEVNAPNGRSARSQYMVLEAGAFELYGLTPAAGRFFSPLYSADAAPLDDKVDLARNVVINEALARALGYNNPQEAVGKIIRFSPTIARSANERRPNAETEVVGVVPDFGASRNLREAAPPRVFFIEPDTLQISGTLHIKLRGQQIPETLAGIDTLWKSAGRAQPIQRTFLNQEVQQRYGEYTRLGETMALFAAIAVFISCLGLFGLAAFAAEQRTKEIGVRKSMGASGADIVRLMLWDFSKPVLWASVVAWPVAYLIMRRWLENFAARIEIEMWMFPLATALALAIALLTVIGHALLVARAEPVKALRYE